MLFNSPIFPLFFGLVYLLVRLSPHRVQNLLLLAASYAFYAWWDWRFLGLIVVSTAVDWICGLALADRDRRHRWLVVATSVVVNLGILAVFKYRDWFAAELNEAFAAMGWVVRYRIWELVLPVGLSFYTFQSMAYTIDVYRGHTTPTRDPLDFALFVSFFPQLVAGPIERSERLLPQLANPRTVTPQQMAEGAHLIVWGYFKKLFVADNLGVVVWEVFEGPEPPSGFKVLVAAYAFTWQIYCDFSGYTDIARGLGKWLGVELSVNFRLPFFAASPQEIWRRWHISLSEWLRDYLYIPLGGGRKGPLRTQLNLLITMLLGGLWHGANWTFIAWGAWHGLALAIQRAVPAVKAEGFGRVVAVVATFHFMVAGFFIFRAHSLAQVGQLLGRLRDFGPAPGDAAALVQLLTLISVPFVVELAMHRRGDDLLLLTRLPRGLQVAASVAMVLAVVVLGASYGQRFIYFQF